jgi:4'-phosphopantetheinyl transferase
VGVDVEPAGAASFPRFADLVLTGAETTWVERAPVQQRDLARTAYWVRKESVLKATGYGLSLPATAVEVTAPDQPPRLVAWHSGDAPSPPPVHLWDIDVGSGHIACVAALAEVAPALQVCTDVSVALTR